MSIVTAEEEQYVTGSLDPSWIDLWIGLSTLVRGAYCGIKKLTCLFINIGYEY